MIGKFSLIILTLFSASIFAQSEVRIISSDRNSITIEYSPVYQDTSFVKIGEGDFLKIDLKSGSVPGPENHGMPAIPFRSLNIGVPSEFGNTVEMLGSTSIKVRGLIIPTPEFVKKGISPAPDYEISSDYYNFKNGSDLVGFGEFGLIRNLPVQTLRINPVRFDPLGQSITLYKTIRFRVNFTSRQKLSSKPADEFTAGTVINFETAKYWVQEKKTSLKKTVFNSVLADGHWVKFEAPEEGIYKIDYSMLSSFGIDPATVDPRKIKIYNNGGKPLPENPNAARPVDLVENAITVAGEADGKFDQGDYILFYGRGNNFWDYDTTSNSIQRVFNVYTDHNYYWITSGGAVGKRTAEKASLSQTGAYEQNSTRAFVSRDDEKINLMNSGRKFLGDEFNNVVLTHSYTNKLDGRISNIPVEYHLGFVSSSSNPTSIDVYENNTNIWHLNMPTTISQYVNGHEYTADVLYNGSLPDNRSNLHFNFTPNSSSAKGYLDYYEIFYQKELTAFNDFLLFFSKDTSSVIEYHLTGFTNSNIKVFDVSDYSGMKQVTNAAISGGEFRFQSDEQEGKVSKYIAVTNNQYKTPVNPQEAENSNIHGIANGARFIIITHKNFMEAADRLKNYRENQAPDKLSSIVVDVDNIFNEFAGGLTDITGIRDFIKYAFDNWQTAPEYVLFLGSGNFDYKDILGYHTNFLPTYETPESFDEINSYTTDDYFVNLDNSDRKIDLAAGRITCKSLESANNVVDKIVFYETESEKGLWRNLITLVADDAYQGADYQNIGFTSSSENLANNVLPQSYNFNKLYMAAFPVVLTGGGKRMPSGNKAILSAMNEGTLVVNYIGHGAPYLWADEYIFEQGVSIPQLHNDRYFLLTAATCDFGYFDDPAFISGAEELVLKNGAGAIASLASTRPVYQTNNVLLMNSFFNSLMDKGSDSTRGIPIGKALYDAKQNYNDTNARKFVIFGDPTLRLVNPAYDAAIDSINGEPVAEGIQIKALSHTRVSGRVLHPDSTLWNNFNGEGTLEVFDSKRTEAIANLNNEQVTRQGGIIFNGRVSVNNGRFDADFIVPKDISYQDQNGKIVFYFKNQAEDGLGFTNKIIVGGTDTNTVNDGKGPDIDIYFDNASALNSNLISPNSNLIIKLADETGLNTTGTGIGHQLSGILNNKENNPIDFSRYFTGDLDAGGRSGEVNYNFSDLEQGEYSLKVKAWDVFNNFSTQTVYFTVVSGDDLEIRDVYNYPNPFSGHTTFTFQRNQISDAEVRVKIYTVAGRLIREIENYHTTDKFVRIPWDGRDQDGNIIANGTYLYKIIIKNLDGNFTKSVLGKLAVIR